MKLEQSNSKTAAKSSWPQGKTEIKNTNQPSHDWSDEANAKLPGDVCV
jgi:hypothetical protein